MLYGKGREAVAGAGEVMEDVIAEVHAEAYEKKVSTMVADDLAHQTASQPHRGNGGSPPSQEKKDTAPEASEERGTS